MYYDTPYVVMRNSTWNDVYDSDPLPVLCVANKNFRAFWPPSPPPAGPEPPHPPDPPPASLLAPPSPPVLVNDGCNQWPDGR